jgi:predicted transcriptional regulator
MPHFSQRYTLQGIQNLIRKLADIERISVFELAQRSGLHPTTLYTILKKKETSRPIRKSTIIRLAESVRYQVTFQGNVIAVTKATTHQSEDDVDDFLKQVKQLIKARGRHLTDEEKGRLLQVVKVMLS